MRCKHAMVGLNESQRAMPRAAALLFATGIATPSGCGSDDAAAATTSDDGSGHEHHAGTDTSTTTQGADETSSTAAGSDEDTVGTSTGVDTGQPSTIAGLVTFVYAAPTASGAGAAVGLVGGYHAVDPGWDGVDDLYSPVMYQLAFPPLPDEPDTLVDATPLPNFAWGERAEWLRAGDGIKLQRTVENTQASVLACRIALAPTQALPEGYPVYTTNTTQAPRCQPSSDAFDPGASYDLVLYGGDLFADDVLAAAITTPAALEVTAPDMLDYGLAIDRRTDLMMSWTAGDGTETIEIRILDADDTLVSVHATDDGATVVPSATLQTLTPGPLDVLIARRRTETLDFAAGTITVTARWEQWGLFNLQ